MIETTAKAGMAVLLAASVPPAPDVGLWAQWGLAGLVVAYTLWRDATRERRMAMANEAQQRWVRDTLLRALERNTSALERLAHSGCRYEVSGFRAGQPASSDNPEACHLKPGA